MTVIRPNSISGIVSLTAHTTQGEIALYKSNGSTANFTIGNITAGVVTATKFVGPFDTLTAGAINVSGDATISGNLGVAGTVTYEDVARVDATGISTFREGFNVGPLAGIALTAYKDGSIRTSGVVTATSYYGSGANLTGITGTTINNNADNRVITGSGTANTLEAESKLTFDGSVLRLENTAAAGDGVIYLEAGEGGSAVIEMVADEADDNADKFRILVGDEGPLKIQNRAGGGWETNIECFGNGAVKIYKDNALKAETTTAGFKVSGDLEVTGSAPGGITQADFWRLTANMQANQLPIASNLARVNTYGFGDASKIGGGMTQSSGIFTFPATGLYWVHAFCNVYSANHSQTNTLQIRYTADGGGNWATASVGAQGIYDQGINSYGRISVDALIDVTSTSNVKVAFNFGAGQGGEYIEGHTVYTYTGFMFIRLGDP